MRVLLSIKPEYAEKIFNGTKKFEFRRTIFKNKKITTVVVYASSPLQMVIGEFKVDRILEQELDELWDNTKEFSGISKEFFDKYFEKKQKGYAIKIKSSRRYSKSLSLKDKFNVMPPQSFRYLATESSENT